MWEIIQPDESTIALSAAFRKKIGLLRLSADDRKDRDLRLVFGSALDRLPEALILNLLFGRPPSWSLEDHREAASTYKRRRSHKDGCQFPALVEAALILALAERHKAAGDTALGDAVFQPRHIRGDEEGAAALEKKGQPVDFPALLRVEPDIGTTNIRNVAS
ncbi:hypothetical protein ACIKT0_08775 [Hansschlegelia beijingensis]|uniref:hypothetical protein n=1 Tax=Hansschlegelia beijingensis TaxID=1133344 RepID=UPI00387F227C